MTTDKDYIMNYLDSLTEEGLLNTLGESGGSILMVAKQAALNKLLSQKEGLDSQREAVVQQIQTITGVNYDVEPIL